MQINFEEMDIAPVKGSKLRKGAGEFRFYHQSSLTMQQCAEDSVALTVTSPPYWNAIDYDIHSRHGDAIWHRERATAMNIKRSAKLSRIIWPTLPRFSKKCCASRSQAGFALLSRGRFCTRASTTRRLC